MTKKNFLLICLSIHLLHFGCQKKENDVNNGIVGNWQVQKVEVERRSSSASQLDVDNAPTGTFVFLDDGTGEADVHFSVFGLNYSFISSFTYNRTGNTLEVITSGHGENTWTILEETDQSFALMWTEPSPDSSVAADFKMYLKK